MVVARSLCSEEVVDAQGDCTINVRSTTISLKDKHVYMYIDVWGHSSLV